jgi:selenocysteine lyase/cysteine desulfurase
MRLADSYVASSEVKAVYFQAMGHFYRGLAAQAQNEHGECVAYMQEAVTHARKAVKLLSKAIPPETQEVSALKPLVAFPVFAYFSSRG